MNVHKKVLIVQIWNACTMLYSRKGYPPPPKEMKCPPPKKNWDFVFPMGKQCNLSFRNEFQDLNYYLSHPTTLQYI